MSHLRHLSGMQTAVVQGQPNGTNSALGATSEEHKAFDAAIEKHKNHKAHALQAKNSIQAGDENNTADATAQTADEIVSAAEASVQGTPDVDAMHLAINAQKEKMVAESGNKQLIKAYHKAEKRANKLEAQIVGQGIASEAQNR
jgi:hypothetical protein